MSRSCVVYFDTIASIPGIRYDVNCPRFGRHRPDHIRRKKVELDERIHLDTRQKAISVQISNRENDPGILHLRRPDSRQGDKDQVHRDFTDRLRG